MPSTRSYPLPASLRARSQPDGGTLSGARPPAGTPVRTPGLCRPRLSPRSDSPECAQLSSTTNGPAQDLPQPLEAAPIATPAKIPSPGLNAPAKLSFAAGNLLSRSLVLFALPSCRICSIMWSEARPRPQHSTLYMNIPFIRSFYNGSSLFEAKP